MAQPTVSIFEHGDFERVPAGSVIFSEGDERDKMYVVREGTVTLTTHGEALEEVGPGGIFGELALIDHTPRSATATATTDCVLVPLDERKFLFQITQTPFFALTVMRVLSSRLRSATPAAA